MTEPWANTNRPPSNTITMMIGANHNFLRTRKNAHNSLINAPMVTPYVKTDF